MAGQTYLVTGGAGFIGSFVCEKLLTDNNHVICVDNFLTGQWKNIKHLQTNKNFTLIEANVTEVPGTSTWHWSLTQKFIMNSLRIFL